MVLTQTEGAYDGYTLLPALPPPTPTSPTTRGGEHVDQSIQGYDGVLAARWQFDSCRPNQQPQLWGRRRGGIVETFDWEGNLTWGFHLLPTQSAPRHFRAAQRQRYLGVKSYPAADWIALGRDPDLTDDVVWSMCIVESSPRCGRRHGGVEMEAINHLVQALDPDSQLRQPALHPRQLDVNYKAEANNSDWLHAAPSRTTPTSTKSWSAPANSTNCGSSTTACPTTSRSRRKVI